MTTAPYARPKNQVGGMIVSGKADPKEPIPICSVRIRRGS
jgi:hypothetical protein